MTSRAVASILVAILVGVLLSASAANAADAPAAELEALVHAPTEAIVGGHVSVSASLANHGPDRATGVRIAVQLTGSFDLVSIAPRGSTCSPPDRSGTIVCDLAELAAGDILGVSITLTPTAAGEIAISATVSANETDPVSGNDTAGASVAVTEAPTGPVDLYTEIHAPEQAFVDGLQTVLVRTRNNGPDAANAARLRVTVTGAYRDLRGATFKGRPCTPDGDAALVCELGHLDLVEFGRRSTVIWFVPTAPGVIRIDVEVTSDQPDLDASNNIAFALVSVGERRYADLGLALTATPNPAHVGRALTYELTAVNNGPDSAGDVFLDFVPGGVHVVAVETTQGTCELPFPPLPQPGTPVPCALGRLEAGGTATIRIEALPSTAGTFTADALVWNAAFGEVDLAPDNDSAAVTTEVMGPGRATTFGAGRIIPVSFEAFVYCTGELVTLEGNLHSRFRLTIDAAGNGHFETHVNAQGVTGVALPSGARYRSTGATSSQHNFSPLFPRTITYVTSQRLVGQGGAADLVVHQNVHVTFGPNGEIRTSVDNFRVECG